MNRFVLHADPLVAARMHCDKHVVKMILEEAQMLSTVQRAHGNEDDRLYRATHRHHPCTVWAGESVENYRWAWLLLCALLREYEYRYGRVHLTSRLRDLLADPPADLPSRGLTPFPQAMPEQFRGDDPVAAYRRFYLLDKVRFARWTRRSAPEWWTAVA